LLAAASGSSRSVRAQEVPAGSTDTQSQTELNPRLKPAMRSFESAERFVLQLGGGPYTVFSDEQASYGRFFSDDHGPNLNAQLDGILYRMQRTFYVTVGGSVGLLNFSGAAVERMDPTQTTSEKTTLSIVPLTAAATIRIDVLPRRLGIPIILAARAGWEWAHWDTNTGARDNATGWSVGPVVSAQVALDLDTFEPGGARALDEEWGINHTFIFGEVFHFAPIGKSLEIGTTSWLVGLGFIF
jgi:hypothetical protein